MARKRKNLLSAVKENKLKKLKNHAGELKVNNSKKMRTTRERNLPTIRNRGKTSDKLADRLVNLPRPFIYAFNKDKHDQVSEWGDISWSDVESNETSKLEETPPPLKKKAKLINAELNSATGKSICSVGLRPNGKSKRKTKQEKFMDSNINSNKLTNALTTNSITNVPTQHQREISSRKINKIQNNISGKSIETDNKSIITNKQKATNNLKTKKMAVMKDSQKTELIQQNRPRQKLIMTMVESSSGDSELGCIGELSFEEALQQQLKSEIDSEKVTRETKIRVTRKPIHSKVKAKGRHNQALLLDSTKGNKTTKPVMIGLQKIDNLSMQNKLRKTFEFGMEDSSSSCAEDESIGLDASINSFRSKNTSGEIVTCDVSLEKSQNTATRNERDRTSRLNKSSSNKEESVESSGNEGKSNLESVNSSKDYISSDESVTSEDPKDYSLHFGMVGYEDAENELNTRLNGYDDALGSTSSAMELSNVSELEGSEDQGHHMSEKKSKPYRLYVGKKSPIKIIVAKCGEHLYLKRSIEIKVLSGGVIVAGFSIDNDHDFVPVHSTMFQHNSPLITIQNTDRDTSENVKHLKKNLVKYLFDIGDVRKVVQLLSVDDFVVFVVKDRNSSVQNYLERFYPSLFGSGISSNDLFHKTKPTWTLSTRKIWFRKAEGIMNEIENKGYPRVLVCGGQGVGKSTFLQFLVNSALNKCSKVCYIDGDPQQAEFTPPGFLSLVVVSQPLLGPGYTHQQQPELMFYQGGVHTEYLMDTYVTSIHKLTDMYYSSPDLKLLPLFVNTMACSKDQEVKLLLDVIHVTRPTEVMQITSSAQPKQLPLGKKMASAGVSWSGVEAGHLWINYKLSKTRSKYSGDAYKPSVMRTISQLAYLAQLQTTKHAFLPINELVPYRVPWSSLSVYICSEEQISESDTMLVLNGSMVALCRRDSSEEPASFLVRGDMPVCTSFGYGIVRGIDMCEKCLYILTPVAPTLLNQVNILVKGSNNIPPSLLHEQSCAGHIPYLSVESMGIDLATFSRALGLSAQNRAMLHTFEDTEVEPSRKRPNKH